jgi:Ca2+/H+ antiporter
VTEDLAAARRRRRRGGWLREWPIALVMLGVVVSLILIALDAFRVGSILLAGSVLLAAFLRLLLPEKDAGLLAVRAKRIDVSVLVALGIALSILGFWVPEPS